MADERTRSEASAAASDIALAGGDGAASILSTLSRAAGGNALLALLDTRDATALRGVCREARDEVAAYPWDDVSSTLDPETGAWVGGTRIVGSLASWRACFPNALGADVHARLDLVDADFVHLRGLRRVNMSGCLGISDAAFVHLRGIHALDMSGCSQAGISDGAFVHLRGIHALDISHCCQVGITAGVFVPLQSLRSLNMAYTRVSGAALFAPLTALESLDISSRLMHSSRRWDRNIGSPLTELGITDANFVHLANLRVLDMACVWQPEITAAAIPHLTGIERLDVTGTHGDIMAAARGLHIHHLHRHAARVFELVGADDDAGDAVA